MTKDIEREAFEKALAGNKIHNLKVCTIFDDEKNEYFASDVCDPSEDHIVESINLSWRMWQAAKAKAVPDGFVVVPKEPHADLVNHGHQVFLGHFNEGGQTGGRSLYFAYKAMIEAQEPTK